MINRTLAIVVVNYGSHELLEANFGSIALDELGARLVVVDNYTSAEELSLVRALCSQRGWSLIHGPNVGFGAGINRGVQHARELGCDTVIAINPDARASSAALGALAQAAREDALALVGPVVTGEDGGHWFAGGRVVVAEGRTTTKPGTDSAGSDGWLTGACLAFRLDLWNLLGGFDERFFLYWEDVDLSWRWRNAGGHLVVRNDIRIIHSVGGTQAAEGRAKSVGYYYFNCRNRMLFAAAHLSRRDAIRWLILTPDYARRVLLRGGRRQFLRKPWRPLWASFAGSATGIRAAFSRSQSRSSSRREVTP